MNNNTRRLPGQINDIDPRQLAAVQERTIAAIAKNVERINEQVQLLTGARGEQGRPMAAVLRDDLSGLGTLQMTAAPAAGAHPTKAEIDALVADVHEINALLVRSAARL